MSAAMAGEFAAVAVALYVAHHVGDYWVQTDHQAKHKGAAGADGRLACLSHVLSYLATQTALLMIVASALDLTLSALGSIAALAVSGITHYMADRREHGLMFKLAHMLGKTGFMKLGVPRAPFTIELWRTCPSCEGRGAGGPASDESTNGQCWDCRGGGQLPGHVAITDNPVFTTGAWALDQSWHIFWGVFVAALMAVTL